PPAATEAAAGSALAAAAPAAAETAIRPAEAAAARGPGIVAGIAAALAGALIARAPFAARCPVLAAPPLVPIARGRNAAAQELVQQVADQPVLLEAGRGIVEALLL